MLLDAHPLSCTGAGACRQATHQVPATLAHCLAARGHPCLPALAPWGATKPLPFAVPKKNQISHLFSFLLAPPLSPTLPDTSLVVSSGPASIGNTTGTQQHTHTCGTSSTGGARCTGGMMQQGWRCQGMCSRVCQACSEHGTRVGGMHACRPSQTAPRQDGRRSRWEWCHCAAFECGSQKPLSV